MGGVQAGSFLRCGDVEGKEALGRLKRILGDYKAGRLVEEDKVGSKGEKEEAASNVASSVQVEERTMFSSPDINNDVPKTKQNKQPRQMKQARLSLKLRPTRQLS